MKIITPKEMARIESLAYQAGASEVTFMENAGAAVAAVVHSFQKQQKTGKRVLLLCGKGNNAGDAYVAGIHLLQWGYDVTSLQITALSSCSPLCQKNHQRFLDGWGKVYSLEQISEDFFAQFDLLIDGIFGTGFRGLVEEPFATVIKKANSSGKPIIALDIPSGLNGETGEVESVAIKATETAFLELPKQGFFFGGGWNHVGTLRYASFGLDPKWIAAAQSSMDMLMPKELQPLLPPIVRTRHKYQAGYVVGLAGSPGMPGAALLASLAALRGGAGMVRLLHPEGMQAELANSPYELIKVAYDPQKADMVLPLLNKATAVFIGPGIGQSSATTLLLQTILKDLAKPSVIDADALTIIAEKGFSFPSQAIITPHRGEMARLLHLEKAPETDLDFLKTCQEYVEKQNVTLVLKGAPTFIFHPGKNISISTSGDPGMATAGSGDVLTGLLAALLAQGMSPWPAAKLAVYLHGLAGECAATEKTSYSLIASDIIRYFPSAFKNISG